MGATNFVAPNLYTFTNLAVTFKRNGDYIYGDGLIVCGSSGQANDGRIGSGSELVKVALPVGERECFESICNWSMDGKWNKIGYTICYLPIG